MILPLSFYRRSDVVLIARELLGKVLVTRFSAGVTAGKIVEVEAYAGVSDKASHAYGNRRTPRTEVMYTAGGVSYVYLCYGIHHLFNVVTHDEGIPHAILVRAIEPLEGIDIMMDRRRKVHPSPLLTAGPGAASQALGISVAHTGASLRGSEVSLEDWGLDVPEADIVAATRVGVAYAAEDAFLPYRFYIRDHPCVSKAKGL